MNFCWTLIKTGQNRKRKILHTVLERRTFRFSSYKNRKSKLRLWWVGARERKKRASSVPFILSEGDFFYMGTLSIKIYILVDIKKHYFMHFLLVFKIVESPQCIFNTQIQLTFWEIHMLIYWQFVKLKLTIVSQTVNFSTSEVSARYSDLTEIKLTVE